MNELETEFVYVKPPIKHVILKASLLLMIMANIALFFAVYEMALKMPFSSTNYLAFGAIMLTANACAALSVINDNWKFLVPLFIVLILCVFTPIFFFLYYISIPIFCKIIHIFAKNERNGTLTKDLIDECVHRFPAIDSSKAYIFLYFGLEKLLELYLVSKLIRLMQKDALEFLRSRNEEEQRRTNDEDSEDDMVVYEKIARSSSKTHPTDVIDRLASIQ